MTSVPPMTCNINNTFHISKNHIISLRFDTITYLFKPHIIVKTVYVQLGSCNSVPYLMNLSIFCWICVKLITQFFTIRLTRNSVQNVEFGQNEFSIPLCSIITTLIEKKKCVVCNKVHFVFSYLWWNQS